MLNEFHKAVSLHAYVVSLGSVLYVSISKAFLPHLEIRVFSKLLPC